MIYRKLVEQPCELAFRVLRQHPVDPRKVLCFRIRLNQIHIQHQCFEQVRLAVVPEVIALAGAGVADDNGGQHVGHERVAMQVGHAVPGVTVGRADQIEHLHVIPILAVELRGIRVKLALGVGHHHRLTSLDGLEQCVPDHRTRLHGARSAKDGDMPVQSGVAWHADDLSVGFSQDRALCLIDI